MGRESYSKEVALHTVTIQEDGDTQTQVRRKEQREVEFFTWEKLDYVDKIKEAFGL